MNVATVADKYAPKLSHVPDTWGAVGHNNPTADEPTPYDTIRQEIEDLFDEAKNWADGEPIANEKQADAVTALLDMVNDAMKRADEARKEEKRPLDEAAAEIQSRYNALIGKTTKLTGRAVLAKEALQGLLTPWRNKLEAERRAEAKRLAKEAADAAAAAQAAMQASRGNLEEREKAEELYQAAQDIERVAKRADKAATTKTGLRSVWTAEMVNQEAALDWAWGYAPERLLAATQQLADEAVRGGLRKVPGFKVEEERVAR
jgi:hypothetical protein